MSRHAAAQAEAIPDAVRADVKTLWRYHDMHHELRPCDVGIGLGSHDLGVAVTAARLFHESLFPRIVFTGANAPTTVERFPRGEAVQVLDRNGKEIIATRAEADQDELEQAPVF